MRRIFTEKGAGPLKRKCLFAAAVSALLALLLSQTALALPDNYYVLDEEGQKSVTPVTYIPERQTNYFGKYGGLKSPEDLFIDKEGFLYVADTGNNRILKLDGQMQVIREYSGEDNTRLNNPKGVFVHSNGDLFIADTGNQRILHITQEGTYVEEFVKPDSELITDNLTFNPSKIAVSSTGIIYLIKGQHFMTLDAYNNFKGYVGSTQVGFDLVQWFIRKFASQEQIERLKKQQPKPYANFCIGEDDTLYAVSLTESGQIRKINAVGTNVFQEKLYGEKYIDNTNQLKTSEFIDIAVDKNGIISALASDNGRIYQYDGEGNMLCSFGGKGQVNGLFTNPVSLAVDGNGCIYVLDTATNSIQQFVPTRFIHTVHEASALYADGRYDQSGTLWKTVLETDSSYALAHTGMAKALFKEGDYTASMQEYDLANNRVGYSKAFAAYRHEIFRAHFVPIVGLGVIGIAGILALLMLFARLSRRVYNELVLRIKK